MELTHSDEPKQKPMTSETDITKLQKQNESITKELRETDKQLNKLLLDKVTSPISLLALITLAVETILGVIAYKAIGNDLTIITTGMVIALFLLIGSALYIGRNGPQEALAGKTREALQEQTSGGYVVLVFEPLRISSGMVFHELTRMINDVPPRGTIKVLTPFRDGEVHDDNQLNVNNAFKQAHEAYFEALLNKVAEPEVSFHRIICFKDPTTNITLDTVGQRMFGHCSKLVSLIDRKGLDKVSLKQSITKFSADIIIIEQKHGKKVAAMSLDLYDQTLNRLRTHGALIFHSPEIIKLFEQWFDEVNGQSSPAKLSVS